MSEQIKLSNKDFDLMVETIKTPPELNDALKELFSEEIPEQELDESLMTIQDQVNEADVETLPLGLRASARRAARCVSKREYFNQKLEVHKARVLKKAKLLFDENSIEYQKVVDFVNNLK